MTQRRSSVRLLCRAGAAALIAGAAAMLGAPAAAAAEAGTPVISLDPPDAQMFLVPVENLDGLVGGALSASADGDAAPVDLAEAASLAPPQIAEALGGESVTVASHSGNGEVDVQYGGTVVVRLPPAVDASAAVVSLVVAAADPDADGRVYSTDPAAPDPLVATDLGGNEFRITLPADDGVYGPGAYLTFDRLAGTSPDVSEVFPLAYYLEFTGTGTDTVTLEPGLGLFTSASCSIADPDPCPATDVQAGSSFDLAVPSSSLLRALDFGRLDTAEVGLAREDGPQDDGDEYWSADDPDLLTRHDASSATVELPADMAAGAYFAAVVEGDPSSPGGYAITAFELDVAAVPVNPGLHSDTGWVDDVRAASAGSTKVVAGITMLVVAGLITVVAVLPRRRPPAGG